MNSALDFILTRRSFDFILKIYKYEIHLLICIKYKTINLNTRIKDRQGLQKDTKARSNKLWPQKGYTHNY